MWWSVPEPASAAVEWILLVDMGSEVPQQAFIIHICLTKRPSTSNSKHWVSELDCPTTSSGGGCSKRLVISYIFTCETWVCEFSVSTVASPVHKSVFSAESAEMLLIMEQH